MKLFFRFFCIALLGLSATLSYAKTYKYEFINPYTNANSEVVYPGLELNNVKSTLFTVTTDPLSNEWQLNTLEITFAKAAKLTASGFKKVSGDTYRAVINDVWIFRQIIVDVKSADLNIYKNPFAEIIVSVSNKSAFNQPEIDPQGYSLFNVSGPLRDISPAKIIDTGYVVIDGKRVNFSLKERPGFIPGTMETQSQQGFFVDVLWMGKGQKTFAIPVSKSLEEYDQLTAIALEIEEIDGSFGTKEQVISVKYKDQHSGDNQTYRAPLKPLLESTYGLRN